MISNTPSPDSKSEKKCAPLSFVRVRNQSVAVIDIQGLKKNGPVLTLIHGIAANAESWLPLVFALLPYCSRFVLPDIPCHGFSPAPKLPFDCIDAYHCVRDLLSQKLDPKQQNIILGNSLGGAFAVMFALEHPELTQKLILISPAGAPFPNSAKDVISPFLPKNLQQAADATKRIFLNPSPLTLSIVAPFLRLSSTSKTFRAIMDSIIDIDQNPNGALAKLIFSPDKLQTLKMPGLLIWGKKDQILPPQMRDFFVNHLPDNFERMLPKNFGHCPQFDHPKILSESLLPFIIKKLNHP